MLWFSKIILILLFFFVLGQIRPMVKTKAERPSIALGFFMKASTVVWSDPVFKHQAQEGSEQAWKQCFLSSEQGPDLLDLADVLINLTSLIFGEILGWLWDNGEFFAAELRRLHIKSFCITGNHRRVPLYFVCRVGCSEQVLVCGAPPYFHRQTKWQPPHTHTHTHNRRW